MKFELSEEFSFPDKNSFILNKNGIIIIETDQKEREIKELDEINVEIYDTRKYGRANLIFLVERG